MNDYLREDELMHYGVKGMKKGIRRNLKYGKEAGRFGVATARYRGGSALRRARYQGSQTVNNARAAHGKRSFKNAFRRSTNSAKSTGRYAYGSAKAGLQYQKAKNRFAKATRDYNGTPSRADRARKALNKVKSKRKKK